MRTIRGIQDVVHNSLANSSAGGTLRLRSLVLARLVAIAAPLPSTVVPITKRLGKAQSVPCQ